jgi:hypothetical protein
MGSSRDYEFTSKSHELSCIVIPECLNIYLATKKIEDVCSVPRYTVFSEYLIYYDTQQLQKDMSELGLLQIDIARYLKVDKHTVSKW